MVLHHDDENMVQVRDALGNGPLLREGNGSRGESKVVVKTRSLIQLSPESQFEASKIESFEREMSCREPRADWLISVTVRLRFVNNVVQGNIFGPPVRANRWEWVRGNIRRGWRKRIIQRRGPVRATRIRSRWRR